MQERDTRKPALKTAFPQAANEYTDAGFVSLCKSACEINCEEEAAPKCKITLTVHHKVNVFLSPSHLPRQNVEKS